MSLLSVEDSEYAFMLFKWCTAHQMKLQQSLCTSCSHQPKHCEDFYMTSSTEIALAPPEVAVRQTSKIHILYIYDYGTGR